MAIITLTSDYGSKDYFISSIKGSILKRLPLAVIVDISHEITPFHLGECAYILRNSYPHFPDQTIHIIGLDSEKNEEKSHIIAKVENQYFIGTDGGLFSLLFQEKKPEKIIKIDLNEKMIDSTFPMKHIFTQIACEIEQGQNIENFGKEIKNFTYNKKSIPTLKTDPINKTRSIIGEVIYIDRFGNAITNISKQYFKKTIEKNSFVILGRENQKISKISKKYSDVTEGNILALFNSANLLEISIMRRNTSELGANTLLGIHEKDNILIDF